MHARKPEQANKEKMLLLPKTRQLLNFPGLRSPTLCDHDLYKAVKNALPSTVLSCLRRLRASNNSGLFRVSVQTIVHPRTYAVSRLLFRC